MTELDASERVYRNHWWLRAFGLLFGIAGTVLFIVVCGRVLLGLREPAFKELLPVAVMLVSSNFVAFLFFVPRVSVYPDRIELKGAFKSKQIPVSAIRGRRAIVVTSNEGSTRYKRLVSSDPGIPSLDLENSFAFDEVFKQWYDGLPDLDVLEPEPKAKGKSKQ